MKNPLTPAGIEPATFRFVAQHLNHCATVVPRRTVVTAPNLLLRVGLCYRLEIECLLNCRFHFCSVGAIM